MKIQNLENLEISVGKIRDYLLSFTHPAGRGKAEFFTDFGFTVDKYELLIEALRNHLYKNNVMSVENSPYGIKYTIEGAIETPDSRNPLIRSVWFVDEGSTVYRFITAYPMKERKE